MNRLRDESPLDPMSERGIAILRAVEPPPRPPELKRRVWASLQQGRHPASSALRPGAMKALVLGAGILAFAATAVGAIGGPWIVSHVERLRSTPAATQPAAVRPEHPRIGRRVAEAEPVAPELPPPAAISVVPAAPPRDVDAHHPRRTMSPAARERTQVLDALIALRRDHDAARATGLLERYLHASRNGALREEALVLAIEAADASADVPGAVRWARTYQGEFPQGRFATFVQSHIKP